MNKYEEIVASCSNLIYMIIVKYFNGYSKEDLYQVGVIGLIKAYDKYKKNKNVKFSTYAFKWIYGEIYSYVCGMRTLKNSSDNIRFYKKINEAKQYLCQELMRNPSNKELSEYLDIPLNLIETTINSMQQVDSLDKVIYEGNNNITIFDMIKDNKNRCNDDLLFLSEELNKLSKEERELIYLRYFEDKTQSEVSKIMGKHQVEISRSENKTLKKIRKNYQNVA